MRRENRVKNLFKSAVLNDKCDRFKILPSVQFISLNVGSLSASARRKFALLRSGYGSCGCLAALCCSAVGWVLTRAKRLAPTV